MSATYEEMPQVSAIRASFHDELRVFHASPDSGPYVGNELEADVDGGELYVAPHWVRLGKAVAIRDSAQNMSGEARDIALWEAEIMLEKLSEEAEAMNQELVARLEALSIQDRRSAQAIQEVTLSEINRRIEERGFDYPQESVEGLRETVSILGDVIVELEEESSEVTSQEDRAEYSALLQLAETWKDEITTDINVKCIQEEHEVLIAMRRRSIEQSL